jgi:hypothetical protein
MNEPKFPLGKVVATPGALAAIDPPAAKELLDRHHRGDWGIMEAEDRIANDEALVSGERLLSSYTVGETKIWIITEADRSVTTLLLPDEY